MYAFDGRVRYSEVGVDGNMTIESLLDYFQDASIFHSEDVGLGVDYFQKVNLVWMLSAWQICVNRRPHLCENIVIGTSPYDFKGFMGSRNFLMKTKEGEVLAYANSICSKEEPSVGYSTVYPLSMFLRILTAQLIVLFCCGAA